MVLHHIHLHLRQQKELLICSGILGSIFSIVKTSSLVVTPLISALILCYCSQEQTNKDHLVPSQSEMLLLVKRKCPNEWKSVCAHRFLNTIHSWCINCYTTINVHRYIIFLRSESPVMFHLLFLSKGINSGFLGGFLRITSTSKEMCGRRREIKIGEK